VFFEMGGGGGRGAVGVKHHNISSPSVLLYIAQMFKCVKLYLPFSLSLSVCVCVCVCVCVYIYIYIYRVSQEECARLQEGVPYIKVYQYNPKHLCPKLNGYGDNDQRKVCSSCGSTHCTCQLTILSIPDPEFGVAFREFS